MDFFIPVQANIKHVIQDCMDIIYLCRTHMCVLLGAGHVTGSKNAVIFQVPLACTWVSVLFDFVKNFVFDASVVRPRKIKSHVSIRRTMLAERRRRN